MPRLWSLCDVAIVPLRDSPVFATVIPSKIFEAMAMGVPVLMSLPEGEATAIIRNGGCGVCVPPEDPAGLASAITALAADPEQMSVMRRAGLDGVAAYSRDVQARRMLDVLRGLGGPCRASSLENEKRVADPLQRE